MFVFMYLDITIENGLSDLTEAYDLSSQLFIRKISGVGHYTKNFTSYRTKNKRRRIQEGKSKKRNNISKALQSLNIMFLV